MSPIYDDDDGMWWFIWNGGDQGPFYSEQEARDAYDAASEDLARGFTHPQPKDSAL